MRILIVGCGSIGTRHLRAFKRIKEVEVIPCDPRKNASKEVAGNHDLQTQIEALTVPSINCLILGCS